MGSKGKRKLSQSPEKAREAKKLKPVDGEVSREASPAASESYDEGIEMSSPVEEETATLSGSEDESSKVDPDSLGQKLTDSAKKKDKNKKNKKNKAVMENEDCKNPETFSSSEKTSKSENPIKFHKNKVKESLSKDSKEVGHILSFMHVIKHKTGLEDSDEEDGESERPEFSRNVNRAQSIGELQERFQKKMAELRGNRKEGQKHGKLSKIEKRQKAKEAKKLKKKISTNATIKEQLVAQGKKKKGPHMAKKVYNSDGKIVFSKFDFKSAETSAGTPNKKQQLDPKAALNRLQKEKEKIKSLAEKGKTERVKTLEDKSAWKKAMEKAEGVKVKDDEALLKKSIKKIEQKKKSSKKKWDDRKDAVEKRKDAKQKKRADNIKNRKDSVKENKMKKAAKRGRAVPGFK